MQLALIIILFYTIIFSSAFAIFNILKLMKRENIYSRIFLIFSAIMIVLLSIPEFIITILTGGEFISVIAKFVVFSILSAFNIYFTYKDIKMRRCPFESININSKNSK